MAEIFVESFDVNVANGSTHSLTTTLPSASSAFIRRPGPSDKASGGPTGSTSNANPVDVHIGMALTATDTITFYAGSSTTRKVMGEVWRYTGPSGGANEFIKRGSYAIALSGSTASQAVSGISNVDDCVPFITGVSTSSSSVNDYETATVYAYIDVSGNVVVGRNNTGTSCTVYVDVVEFTGSNWSVGHGLSASHDSVDETVTLNTASTGTGGSTFDVGNWETAFLEINMGGDSSETGLSDVLATAYPGGSTTQVVFGFEVDGDGTAANDSDAYIHVIKHPDIVVKRTNTVSIAEGNGTYGTATWPSGASTARNLNELGLEWFCDTTGTGTAHARGRLNARITAATGTIQHWVHRSGNDVDVRYGVIDLSGIQETSTGDDLTADSITSGVPTLDTATIAQVHGLGAQAITSGTPAVDTGTLALIVSLSAVEIAAGVPTVDAGTLGQAHNLTATDITSGTPTLDTPACSSFSADVLGAGPLVSGAPTLDVATITQRHALLGAELAASSPAVDAAALGQIHGLAGLEVLAGAVTLAAGALGQLHVITAVGLTSGTVTLDAPVLFTFGDVPVEVFTATTAGVSVFEAACAGVSTVTATSAGRSTVSFTTTGTTSVSKASSGVSELALSSVFV